MKKFIYTLAFAMITMLTVSACSDESITPAADSGGTMSDKCQFGGPGCPKG